jgi:hypothetical protein
MSKPRKPKPKAKKARAAAPKKKPKKPAAPRKAKAKKAAPPAKPAATAAVPQVIDAVSEEQILATLAAGLGAEAAARLGRHLRSQLRVRAVRADDVPTGASRFGGHPDLPEVVAWPEADGVPMELIAQIDLAEAAPHDADGLLPPKGTLIFFYNSQWQVSDMAPDFPCAQVLYFDDHARLGRRIPPVVEYQHEFRGACAVPYVHGLARLSFSRQLSLPAGVSAFLADEDPALRARWQDFDLEHGAKLPPLDVKDYTDNRMLGYLSNQDYVGAMNKDDVLLLQVDSEPAAGFQWGDCDKLYFVCKASELAARDFSRVRLYSILG